MWQPSDLPQVYLKRAEACRIAAEKASEPEIRAAYMDVATQWEALAQSTRRENSRETEYDSTRNPSFATRIKKAGTPLGRRTR
jgi:hypothetical protein